MIAMKLHEIGLAAKAPLLALALVASALPPARAAGADAPPPTVELRTPSNHPMKYYVSLPEAWSPKRKWPVVMAIEDAHREYEATAQAFAAARGARPFIVVVPQSLNSGGTAQQHRESFAYSDSDWAVIERVGNCDFDDAGIAAVLADVKKRYNGDPHAFLTGFEAGGHVVWAQVFLHPERWRAAALVGPNYIERCMKDGAFSKDPSRAALPVQVFHGASDPGWHKGGPLYEQTRNAIVLARNRGFRAISEQAVPGKTHEPLPAEVLDFFTTRLEP
jgi:hypothetical protein